MRSALTRRELAVISVAGAASALLQAGSRPLYAAPVVSRISVAPAFYVYPSAFRYADGHPLDSPQTMSVAQATSDIPDFEGLSGVAVMVYWSMIEPAQGKFNFSMIDEILAYWARRNKRVILDICTIGYPVRTADGNVLNAAPAWALKQFGTYVYPSRILGFPGSSESPATMPDFRDGTFIGAVRRLAEALLRYDGHRQIAQLRIPVGLMGEDNPLVGPVIRPLAWYTEGSWLTYCATMVEMFSGMFRRTQLEFDIGRVAWMSARGSDEDRSRVDGFIGMLLKKRIFLAFDGLNSASLAYLREPAGSVPNGLTTGLRIIRDYARHGGDCGLEAASPLASPKMRDVGAIVTVIDDISPKRLVFFSDIAAGWAPASSLWQTLRTAYGLQLSQQVAQGADDLVQHLRLR